MPPARCPFSTHEGDHVRRCPGFTEARIGHETMSWYSPDPLAGEDGLTCAHLGAERSSRGWMPACGHPDGLPDRAREIAGSLLPPPLAAPGG